MQGFHEPQSASSASHVSSERSVLIPVIARLGLPVLLFGGVFLVLVGLLTFLTSPDRFPVHTGDSVVRIVDLESRSRALLLEKESLKAQRVNLNIDEKAPVLTTVRSIATNIVPLGDTLLSIEDVRSGFRSNSADPITLPRVEYDNGTLTLAGEVRDPSGRSMQILASFVDGLRDIATVTNVTEPEYISHPDPRGGTVSPFLITITLRRA